VEGTVITVNDLDEKLRGKVMVLGDRVAEARKTARRVEVESKLFELEAARLHVASRDLYFEQVIRKETPVTEAEVRAEYDSNPDLYGSRTLDAQRDWIEGNIAEKHEAARASAYAGELQKSFPLEEASIPADAAMAAAEYNTRMTPWREEHQAVAALIHQQLLKTEAARRNVTPEELTKAEVDAKLKAPTDEELAAYYEKWKTFFSDDYKAAKPKVAAALQRDRRAEVEEQFDAMLRAGREVRNEVTEPQSPHLSLDIASLPSRGDAHAAVTIIEFGDFECPPCGRMWGIVEEALAPYGDKVRYVFHNNPLRFHPFAFKAAEAGLAAQDQGRFFQYADVLFRNQKALDVTSLKKYATQAGLDAERFAKDLDAARFAPVVAEQRRNATRHGVISTPIFFINGERLPFSAYGVAGIRAVIDAKLKR
jgi:protein-disulfide isomerase